MSAKTVEIVSLVTIAVAFLVGGRSLLVAIAHAHVPAALALVVLAVAQLFALRRNYSNGGPLARIRVSRDVAFAAALIAAAFFVTAPARWSLGASIAAFEFGLAIEILARLAPPAAGAPPATPP